MAVQITAGTGRTPGPGGRQGARTSGGQMWVAVRTGGIVEFYYSNNDGASWSKDTGADLSGHTIGDGHSLFISADDDIWCAYPYTPDATNDYFRLNHGTISGNTITWDAHASVEYMTNYGHSCDIVAFNDDGEDCLWMVWTDNYNNARVARYPFTTYFGSRNYIANIELTPSVNQVTIDFDHTGNGKTPSEANPTVTVYHTQNGYADTYLTRLLWGGSAYSNEGKTTIVHSDSNSHSVGRMRWDGTRYLIATSCNAAGHHLTERDAANTTTTNRNPTDKHYVASYMDVQWDGNDDTYVLFVDSNGYPCYYAYDRSLDTWSNRVLIEPAPCVYPTWVRTDGLGPLYAVWGYTYIYGEYVLDLGGAAAAGGGWGTIPIG